MINHQTCKKCNKKDVWVNEETMLCDLCYIQEKTKNMCAFCGAITDGKKCDRCGICKDCG